MSVIIALLTVFCVLVASLWIIGLLSEEPGVLFALGFFIVVLILVL